MENNKNQNRVKTFQVFQAGLGQPLHSCAVKQHLCLHTQKPELFWSLLGCLPAAGLWQPTQLNHISPLSIVPRSFPQAHSLSHVPLLARCGEATDAGPYFFFSPQFKWTFAPLFHIQAGHHLESVIYLMVVLTPLRNRLLSWFIDSFFPLLIWLIS